ncbi:tetratricopeptide repeat protein [Nocardioides gansuensis]|nr:tetratricopeptide repeat protein [Nocardioides gansuensis]
MTDFTPFEELLRGHAGMLGDSPHDRWRRAQALFDQRAYREAAVMLRDLIDSPEAADFGHALIDVRLLLARAYFHSAQLNRTIETAESLLEDEPGEAYAHLLVGRALQRQGKKDEARGHLKLAELLGGYRA